ncbi:hypothetical protein lerEdw1_004427 [Lerista edwardsae]|nr:hypothetical protein lerEdw1_004427 [Lerista edwardsae]
MKKLPLSSVEELQWEVTRSDGTGFFCTPFFLSESEEGQLTWRRTAIHHSRVLMFPKAGMVHWLQQDHQYQEAFVKEAVSLLSLVSQAQNETSIWRILLMAPDITQGVIHVKDMLAALQSTNR